MIKASDAVSLVREANAKRDREIEDAKRQVVEQVSEFLNKKIAELARNGETQLRVEYDRLLNLSFKRRSQSNQVPPRATDIDVREHLQGEIERSGYTCAMATANEIVIIWGDGTQANDDDQ